jgi:hypothetical protein
MKNFICSVFAIFALVSNAQIKVGGSYKDYFQEGSYLLLEDNYLIAKENFEAAYKIDSTSANINYLLGQCYLHSLNQKSKAEYHLAKAVKNVSRLYKNDNYQEKDASPLAHLYYAQALHINYKFDEAIKEYQDFEKLVNSKDEEWRKIIERGKATSNYAKELVSAPLNVKITNLGDSVNSEYPDYSPILSSDERMLIYTTRRPNITGGDVDNYGYYSEDVVVSYKNKSGKWTLPQSISNNINSSRGMEASINLTPDGQTLLVYRDDGEGLGSNIYYSKFEGKDWSPLKEFGSDINSRYTESHACLNTDQTVLFFVSDRPGGFGGKDIYRCIKLPNGEWSKAINMGPTINTEYDEDGAYIHPDGVTFFFASKGHKTMGGYDIMFTTLDEENKFTEVTNIGYPINTTDDDLFYTSSPDGKRGYFSSAKAGGFGEKDLYVVSIPEAKEKPLALFKGQIIASEGEKLPEDIVIVVKDKKTGEIIGMYRPKLVDGTFSTILPLGHEYNFSYQAPAGQEFYNEDIFVTGDLSYSEINREVKLAPVEFGKVKVKGKSIVLNTIVYSDIKTKKPISGAKISVEEQGGTTQSFTSSNNGGYDGIVLNPDKKYSIYAEDNGKKSTPIELSTLDIKNSAVIGQIIYMSDKVVNTSKDLLLNITVRDLKTKKIVPNAEIILSDGDGNKINTTTDEMGLAKDIELAPDTKYKIIVSKDGIASDNGVSTIGVKGTKRFNKTILIGGKKSPTSIVDYEFYFKYNKNMNEDTETWTSFIDKIVELSKRKTVFITINASASKVPTRTFKNNAQLASSRANKLEDRIKEAYVAKGANVKKLKFIKKSVVGGPAYKGDWDLGRTKYEANQYVKAKAK